MSGRFTVACALVFVGVIGQACEGGAAAQCAGSLNSDFRVWVVAPDGTDVCDATVTVTEGRESSTVVAFPSEGGCSYPDFSDIAGTFDVTASNPGYLDAHGTTHVTSSGGSCPTYSGKDVTLHLVRAADAGVSDVGE